MSKYEVRQWAKKIKQWLDSTNRTSFSCADLPDYLYDISKFRSAIQNNILQATGEKTGEHKRVKVWRVNPDDPELAQMWDELDQLSK